MSEPMDEEHKEEKTSPDGEEHVEADSAKKDDLIEDIMANNAVEIREEENTEIMFAKAKVIEEVELSFWNLDVYLHNRYKYVSPTLRKLLEILVVVILFMGLPVALEFMENGKRALVVFREILQNRGKGTMLSFVKVNLFLTLCHTTYVMSSVFGDNVLYLMVTVLGWLGVEPNEYIIEMIQVIDSTSWCWKQALGSIGIFYIASALFQPYKFGDNDGSYKYIGITFLFVYFVMMTVVFVEKFCMCLLVSEIRKKEHRNRIWDINYKTFIFKKLAAISETGPSGRGELAETMEPEFDPGFYMKYNDLKLNSVEAAEMVAESIFGFLEIRELIYGDIEKFFPQNHEEVYGYLSESSKEADGEHPAITFEELKTRAVALYRERTDISRSLQSRDNVINKLDVILVTVSIYFGGILVMLLLRIDYKVFLASMGPSVVTFGWVFSDTIKEIYNCFVFLLVNHPYDFGDRVVIDGEELQVSSIDLMSSTFVGENGRQAFIPTNLLFKKKIYNIRRSGKQFEVVEILLSRTTAFDAALKLQDAVSKKLAASAKSFSGEMHLRSFRTEGDSVKIGFAVQLQSNFQDVKRRRARRMELVDILEKEMRALGMTYLNSYAFKN